MRLLVVTNLYPSKTNPRQGIFVAERLRHLIAAGARAQVVALRPSIAGFSPRHLARARETVNRRRSGDDFQVQDVSVPTLPLLTNWLDPWLWSQAVEPAIRKIIQQDPAPTIIDGHFLYPDGVAAVLVAKKLGLPVVLTARGSDVNVKCRNLVMRTWVRWAASNCSALITVSSALATALTDYGVIAPTVAVLPNGVDLHKFCPRDSAVSRARYAAGGRLFVSVGNLIALKGHHIAIEAIASVPDATLLIVGEGPQRDALRRLAAHIGVNDRVKFSGAVPHDEMPDIYAAADALLLPSASEGMPNVVLESLACGTRVVATKVGGVVEVLTSPRAGELMSARSVPALLEALERLSQCSVSRSDTRAHAENFGWPTVVEKQLALYRRALDSK